MRIRLTGASRGVLAVDGADELETHTFFKTEIDGWERSFPALDRDLRELVDQGG